MESFNLFYDFIYSEEKLHKEMKYNIIMAIGVIFIIMLPNICFNKRKDEYDEIIENCTKKYEKELKKR
jgi:hypothetical protein